MKNIAVITGASGGIGKFFAETLSTYRQDFDEVWVIARNRERLMALEGQIPFQIRAVCLDLSLESSYDEYKKLLEEEKPRVGLLVNCSGYGKFDSTEKLSYEENMGMIDLNCRALTALAYLSLPYMDAGCEILNVASVAAFQPIPYVGVYGATKAYVLSFSRALGRELKGRGIRVFAVCPFWTKTEFFNRAVDTSKEAVVKKYVAMYEPVYIAKYTWRSMKNKRRDYCIPGIKSKLQVLAVKLLPHSLIMRIWEWQQGLNK